MVLHPDCHTYMSPTATATQSTIDHVITNSTIPIGDITRIDDLFSDHWAFTATIGIDTTPTQRYHLDYKKTNWATFAAMMTIAVHDIPVPDTTEEIDLVIAQLTQSIQQACDTAIPKITEKAKLDHLPDDTCAAIRELRRLKRQWNRNRHQPDKPLIRSQLQRCHAILAQLFKRNKHEKWTKLTDNLNGNMSKCWRIVRTLKTKSGGLAMPSLRSTDGNNYIIDKTEKAEIMATEFSSYHNPGREPKASDRTIINDVEAFVESNEDNRPDFHPITIDEVTQVWQSFRPFKCPGIDRIMNAALKKLPPRPKQLIVDMKYWPEEWKLAKVVCIPKRGKQLDLRSSYRPISLWSGLSKTFERIVADRLTAFTGINDTIQSHQFGFRQQHSAVQQALRFKQHVLAAREHRQSTGAIFLDVNNAFPSVWIQGLIAKMIRFGFPDYLTLIIHASQTDDFSYK